ncbi:MAG: GumC family protein [Planctomycetales bacterium]|nr:GumC family protein [Planctomycetales bacterium]
MNRNAPFELSLRDVYRVIFRHRQKAIAVFGIVLALVVVYTAVAPRSYHSSAKLFVRLGRENTSLDATATLGQSPVISIPQSRENELNTVVEILASRSLGEQVIERVGLQLFLGESAPEDPMAREKALAAYLQGLNVEPITKSNVVAISYRARDPRVAQKVVAALTDIYLSEHVRLNRTEGAFEFLEEETARVREQLAHNEKRLREFKRQTGIVSPEEQRRLLVTRVARLEDALLDAESALIAGASEARVLRNSLGGLGHIQVTGHGSSLASTAADDVRKQLYSLQLREQQLLSQYTEEHVLVRQVRDEIDRALALLRQRDGAAQAPSHQGQDDVATGIDTLVDQEPRLIALKSQAEETRRQLAEARRDVEQFNENEYRIAELEREIQLLDTNYRKYSDNLEQARIDHSLESRRMSNISVVQPATFEPRPDSPKKALLLIFGAVFATACGVGVSLVRELLDHSLKTPEEIERRLDLPTLAAIPRVERGEYVLSGRN